MKYAIYDKAADGYLTKMEIEVGYSEHTQFECGYNEYITEAQLLDTPKEAADAIVRIESCKFMEKGRFVIHSFDDTLKDQYIISEAGEPIKVVDNITVDLEGNINVKYGTMVSHWSTAFLEYAVNRMNALQKAKSPKYTAWCNTFDIYKVITIIDEKSCTHYQFINVTAKGLEKYAKDEEVVSFNKRIEELEKTNYEFGKRLESRATLVNDLRVENTNLKNKVESIKKEAHDWKKLYEKANKDREILTNVIDNIYDDLGSTDIRKGLKETYDYIESLSELNYIKIHNDDTDDAEVIYAIRNAIYNNDSDAFDCIISRMRHDPDFSSDPFMAGVRENILDICNACKRNIANNDLKNSEIARLTNERDKALERAEKFKGIANSIYGITIPGRCNGKQGLRDMLYDLKTGMKVLVDKKKYDDLVEYVANINLTYDTITEYLNDLTK